MGNMWRKVEVEHWGKGTVATYYHAADAKLGDAVRRKVCHACRLAGTRRVQKKRALGNARARPPLCQKRRTLQLRHFPGSH